MVASGAVADTCPMTAAPELASLQEYVARTGDGVLFAL
jgi:hypothetical protein